jgi:hypothetical protein
MWIKLYDGEWGVKMSSGASNTGDTITVESKDGRKTDVVLGDCLGADFGWSIWRVGTQQAVKSVAGHVTPAVRRKGVVVRKPTRTIGPVMTPEPPQHSDDDEPSEVQPEDTFGFHDS